MRFLKKLFKFIERRFFNLLKFDLVGYRYKKPKETDVTKLRLLLVDDYFAYQPGLFRIAILSGYLFVKKAVLFVLRRLVRIGRLKSE